MKTILLLKFLLIFVAFDSCSQNNNRTMFGREYAEKQLNIALQYPEEKRAKQAIIQPKETVIKDSQTATNIAEAILFDIYGKENIIRQKPYEIYHLKNYWFLQGTLPLESVGGTFLIILDDKNAKILTISHGK